MSKNLILVLNGKLKTTYVEQLLPNLSITNVKFGSIIKSDFIGFYDWLRVHENQICGVRISPFDFAKEIIGKIPAQSYTKLQSDGALEIYFSNAANYIQEISCDQDFGSVKIYISDNSEYAIGFNIENLTLIEQQNLHQNLPQG